MVSGTLALGFVALLQVIPVDAAPTSSAAVSRSADASFLVTEVPIHVNDLAYDEVSDTVFASVAGGNSVMPIEPSTGALGEPIIVSSEPNQLAVSDDGSFLYVGLDAEYVVARINLASRSVDLRWSVGLNWSGGALWAGQIAVMPGHPETVAIRRADSSFGGGVVVYDAGVARPAIAYGPELIAFSDVVPNRLYGYSEEFATGHLHRLDVGVTGPTEVDKTPDVLRPYLTDLDYDSGLVFGGWDVADAEARSRLGTFARPPDTLLFGLVGDAANERAFVLGRRGSGDFQFELHVFDTTTFERIASLGIVELTPVTAHRTGAFIGAGFGTFALGFDESVLLIDVTPMLGSAGEHTALTPSRVLDTRVGIGRDGVIGPLAPGGSISVQLSGRGGVPADGVDAVVVNATVAEPTAPSFLTVWPSGVPRPNISNLNYVAGATRANLVTVALGAGGRLDVYNNTGEAHVVFDVVGFYSTATGPPGSRFRPLTPSRAFDTRDGTGGVPNEAITPGQTLRFNVLGVAGVPSSGVTGVVFNVTATNASTGGYLTVWPDDAPRPNASSLNFTAGSTVPNLVSARVPPSGMIDFFNYAGETDVVADVVGYYTLDRSSDGGRFVALTPFRLFDTREESPFDPPGRVPPGNGVVIGTGDGNSYGPDTPFSAVVLNVTATATTGAGYVIVHPSPDGIPTASNLNYVDGDTVPNAVIARTGPDIGFSNEGGSAHLVADVFGAFTMG